MVLANKQAQPRPETLHHTVPGIRPSTHLQLVQEKSSDPSSTLENSQQSHHTTPSFNSLLPRESKAKPSAGRACHPPNHATSHQPTFDVRRTLPPSESEGGGGGGDSASPSPCNCSPPPPSPPPAPPGGGGGAPTPPDRGNGGIGGRPPPSALASPGSLCSPWPGHCLNLLSGPSPCCPCW